MEQSTPIAHVGVRPTREKKAVERYVATMTSSPRNFISIEKGNGIPLKDIPNVALKLSKRKPDDNLKTLHSILFGMRTKVQNMKKNIGDFSGYKWDESQKEKAKIKEKLDKCIKEKLVNICDMLNIPIAKSTSKKDLAIKILEFLECPHVTTDRLLWDIKKKRKGSRTQSDKKRSRDGTPGVKAKKQSSKDENGDMDSDGGRSMSLKDNTAHGVLVNGEEASPHKKVKVAPSDTGPTWEAPVVNGRKRIKHEGEKVSRRLSTQSAGSHGDEAREEASGSFAESKGSMAENKKHHEADEEDGTENVINRREIVDGSKEFMEKIPREDHGGVQPVENPKAELTRDDIHAAVEDILKNADFSTATLADVLKQLCAHFDMNLAHRASEVKEIIGEVISGMTDAEDEEGNS